MERVLVANRGEIAIRVMRACQELGIETVAVYSDADAKAIHVKMANKSVRLGPAPSSQSYLNQEAVLEAARSTGADAIHPGYGFLSENAEFAQKVLDAGITWIGPSPAAMQAMGDKVQARAQAEAAGVPLAPGSPTLTSLEQARKEANRIGYPVMMKASAGGGGIGMRILQSEEELEAQFEAAREHANSAFGVPDVFMERFIARPRHIEVQILADTHGNVVHLFERECSIQRRHQKLVEEAPSPALSQEEREEIGQRAVALAKRVGYTNAGTMEFLFERDDDGTPRWSFNEMNTRLQVEHPVTELVTGIDLVQMQLRVARGEELPFKQSDIQLNGHAFEARINAEDPSQGFRPSPGTVTGLAMPSGPGIRLDGCLETGWTVPDCYDSMVLKLITHASDRGANVRRMKRALADLEIHGFATNAPWHQLLFSEPDFVAGDMSTRYLEEHTLHGANDELHRKAAALAATMAVAPGGGLAGIQMRLLRPKVLVRGGQRNWRSD